MVNVFFSQADMQCIQKHGVVVFSLYTAQNVNYMCYTILHYVYTL